MTTYRARFFEWFGVLTLAVFVGALAATARPPEPSPEPAARVSIGRQGILATQDGLQLLLRADTGSVHVFTDATGEVRYTVRVETESGGTADALLKAFSLQARSTSRGVSLTGRMPTSRDAERIWVTYEIHLPRRYNLEISTRAGDITTGDIDGAVALSTGGGNIDVGSVGDGSDRNAATHSVRGRARFAARFETSGGQISVGEVSGGVRATTGGGPITTGNIYGDAFLHTAGGNLHVGRVEGLAQLTTGGGNILVESAAREVEAESAGGRIEFGEVAGAIHARTNGAGLRIARVAGPAHIESSDGGIVLAEVKTALHASTTTGGITAWLSPQFGKALGAKATRVDNQGRPQDPSLAPPSRVLQTATDLNSGEGDIIVYLPRTVAVTVNALVEDGGHGRITADPALPLKVSYEEGGAKRTLHARCDLNGGGEVLNLRAMAGNIQLRFLDGSPVGRLAQLRNGGTETVGGVSQDSRISEVRQQIPDVEMKSAATAPSLRAAAPATNGAAYSVGDRAPNAVRNPYGSWWQEFWWGGVRVDPGEQQKRLSRAVTPEYPDAARQAGIEGDVALRVVVGTDGVVNQIKLLSGNPDLARAAMQALAQWRYAPALLDGWPVSVVTTVTVAFRLH